jgi:hypothetical protein
VVLAFQLLFSRCVGGIWRGAAVVMVSAGSAVSVVVVGVVARDVLMILRRVKCGNRIIVVLIDKVRKITTLTGTEAHDRRHHGTGQEIYELFSVHVRVLLRYPWWHAAARFARQYGKSSGSVVGKTWFKVSLAPVLPLQIELDQNNRPSIYSADPTAAAWHRDVRL